MTEQIPNRRCLTWGEAYERFVLGLIAAVLTLGGIIGTFVGVQLRELTLKVQELSVKFGEMSVAQNFNAASHTQLQSQIDSIRADIRAQKDSK